jgi:hypothetical protein
MATKGVIDFDAWRAERVAAESSKAEPVKVKVGGKEYPLPPTLPATVALDVIRYRRAKGDDATVPATMLMNIGESLFGTEAFRKILDENGLDVDGMGQLIMMAFKAYDQSEGEDAVPNRKTRRAQKRST